jgi:hypothetical protein
MRLFSWFTEFEVTYKNKLRLLLLTWEVVMTPVTVVQLQKQLPDSTNEYIQYEPDVTKIII